jgi:hypothetical protein
VWALAIIAVAYGLVVIGMMQIEDSLVYQPTRPHEEWIDKPSETVEDITLRTLDGALHGWFCASAKSDVALLICHGTAGNLSVRGYGLPHYRDVLNASILIFDYPGYGISQGRPSERGCYEAADSAFDWLVRVKKFSPDRIIVYGESLGGGVAVDLASRRKNAGLILVNTFATLPEVAQREYPWLPVLPLMRNRFDSESKISQCTMPLFLTHGTADDLCPFEHAERLFARASGPKRFMPMKGKGHLDPLGDDFLIAVRDFFRTHRILPRP